MIQLGTQVGSQAFGKTPLTMREATTHDRETLPENSPPRGEDIDSLLSSAPPSDVGARLDESGGEVVGAPRDALALTAPYTARCSGPTSGSNIGSTSGPTRPGNSMDGGYIKGTKLRQVSGVTFTFPRTNEGRSRSPKKTVLTIADFKGKGCT